MNDKEFYANIGNQLYKLRTKKGMYQQDIADALNTTKATVSRWESGDRPISAACLKQYVYLLGYTLQEFFTFIDK